MQKMNMREVLDMKYYSCYRVVFYILLFLKLSSSDIHYALGNNDFKFRTIRLGC